MATLNGSLFCFSETLLNLWKQNTKQMKSTQLRIGNWYSEYGIPKQATPEIISNLYAIEQNGKTAIDFDFLPLTEEWLLKAGAEAYEFDHKPSQYIIGDRLIVIRDGCFYEYGTNLKLEFVHRFQNLFFELQNGKELEFKL